MTRLMSALCAAVAVTAGAYAIGGINSQTKLPDLPLVAAAEAQEVDTSTIVEMVQGAEDAPVTLIEYASYTCPHCAAFHNGAYQKLKEDFIDTGKVKFIYREVYFDKFGLWASMIARCGGQEKFFGITELMFKSQSEWARGSEQEIVGELSKIGRLAGIDEEQLNACLQDGTKAQTLVSWYQENANRDGVNATPTFILNGELVKNQPYEDIKALIEEQLDS